MRQKLLGAIVACALAVGIIWMPNPVFDALSASDPAAYHILSTFKWDVWLWYYNLTTPKSTVEQNESF